MKTYVLRCLFIFFSMLFFSPARASHMEGGQMTYVYLGDSATSGETYYKYQVTLTIYVDCLDGSPEAIADDNPAFLGVFYPIGSMGYAVYELDSCTSCPNAIFYNSSTPIPESYANACGSTSFPPICLLKKTFVKTYALPANTTGYVVAYQRCCRNAGIANIVDPANVGSTIWCTIPATSIINNSAAFKNDPPTLACTNRPFYFDHSATDVDGDSLTYSFTVATDGADGSSNSKPDPIAPPYHNIIYVSPWSFSYPVSSYPVMAIDSATGMITGTPNLPGRYQLAVACYEWRGGQMINKVTREFEVIVNDCSSSTFTPVAGPDTSILVGDSVQFYASPAATYSWSPSFYLNNTNTQNPVGVFNTPGIFTYTLNEVTDSGCDGEATVEVQVLEYSNFTVPNAFTPNGDNLNDVFTAIPVLGSKLISLRVYDRGGIMVYNGGSDNPGWDGTYKGVKQDIGTYFWELLYYDNNGATRHMKGNVTLIR